MHNHINKNLPLIVIFGRTNVGKSTLFNRLIAKNQALVSDVAGTTRDSNIAQIKENGIKFQLVDTGGIEFIKSKVHKVESKESTKNNISKSVGSKVYKECHEQKLGVENKDEIGNKVYQQVIDYLENADLILFLVDNETGLLPQDIELGQFLKKTNYKNKTILIVNKVGSVEQLDSVAEFYKLSLGKPIAISAITGLGVDDMFDVIIQKFKSLPAPSFFAGNQKFKSLKVCIIGKPNVGKSSLLNSILGYERVIVSEKPHTTREPQNTDIEYNKQHITLIDTAGISKRGTKTKEMEKYGIFKSLSALKRADVALLVIDIKQGITHQDAKLVQEIFDRKKSLIIIANKWDLIQEQDTKKYTQYVYAELPFATWAPIHFTSALTKSKVHKILGLVLDIAEQRSTQVDAVQLKEFIDKIVKIHAPAKGKGARYPRIYEIRQVKINPPQFEIQIKAKSILHKSYVGFIENNLRKNFGFIGTPMSLYVTDASAKLFQ